MIMWGSVLRMNNEMISEKNFGNIWVPSAQFSLYTFKDILIDKDLHETKRSHLSYAFSLYTYTACPETKCTEALMAWWIFSTCWLQNRVAWFLPSAVRLVQSQYVENCSVIIDFVKNVNPIPVKCKICIIIHYFIRKGKPLVKVYNEVKTAYGDKYMNHTSVFKWCGEFNNGRMSAWWSEEQKTFNCDWRNCAK